MYPWVDLYFVKIPSFGLMVAFAFLICNHLLKKEFPKNGLDSKIADDIVFYSIISAIVGSKLYHVIESGNYFQLYHSLESIIINLVSLNFNDTFNELQYLGSGLVFNGGFICAILFILIYLKNKKINFLRILDIVGPFVLLGHGIGRIGCLLVGDDYGIPTNLPWAITLENGLPPTTIETFSEHGQFNYLGYSALDLQQYLISGSNSIISVHPTQIYEMSLYFIGFYILRSKFNVIKQTLGQSSAYYLMYAGISRFLVEIIRTNERYMFNLSSAQYISIILFITGIILYFNLNKINKLYGNN